MLKKFTRPSLFLFIAVLPLLILVNPSEARCWKNQWGWKICDFEKPEGTPLEPIIEVLDQAAIPPEMRGYIQYLEVQAKDKKRGLPNELKSAISGKYNIDFDKVRYATGIDTVHGQAITIGNNIYFPRSIDFNDRSDLHWMLHELEHVRQYKVHNGIAPFLLKYVVQGGIQIGSKGSFDIHDNIELEREADRKADSLIDSVIASLSTPIATASKTSPGTQFIDTMDIPISQLGTPSSFEARFRAVHDWATRNGYVAGFPNFHQADYGQGVVYGTILFKEGVEWRDIPASELGNPANNEARFRAVHDWATRNGYVAGFPNFHQADYGQGVVYGTILIKK